MESSPVSFCDPSFAMMVVRISKEAKTRQEGDGMDFVAVVDQVISLLRQRGRVTYRTLQRQFQLDEDALADLLAELRYAYRDDILEEAQGLLWVGDTRSTLPATTSPAAPTALAPRTYTPA